MRRAGVGLVVLGVALWLASNIWAATGKLTPVGCVSNSTETTCTQEPGLGVPISVETSPDGLDVYVASSKRIVQFRRDPGTGLLTYAGCVGDAASGCAVTGLPGSAHPIAISPDGKSVYGLANGAIVVLSRDQATGSLSIDGCVASSAIDAPEGCEQRSKSLLELDDIVVSPDGRSVYVATSVNSDFSDPGALVRLARNRKTGMLAPKDDCIQDGDWAGAGAKRCPRTLSAYYDPGGLSTSPNGKSVYSVSSDGVVYSFKRDRQSGRLKPAGCVEDKGAPSYVHCERRATGLDDPLATAVSPDGRSVYVHSSQALVSLRRDKQAGRLRFRECIEDANRGPFADPICAASGQAAGAYFRGVIVASPDGHNVYTAANLSIGIFNRGHSGGLTSAGCVGDTAFAGGTTPCETVVDGLDGVWSLAVSPDGLHLYAVSSQDDSLVILARP